MGAAAAIDASRARGPIVSAIVAGVGGCMASKRQSNSNAEDGSTSWVAKALPRLHEEDHTCALSVE